MKSKVFACIMLAAVLVFSPSVFAGTYTADNKVVHLQGDTGVGMTHWLESQVKLKFVHLKIGWDSKGTVNRIRYSLKCKDGKIVLQNVEVIEDGKVRWAQSGASLNKDFSYIKDDRDRQRDNTVKFSSRLSINPVDLATVKVRFQFEAKNRKYYAIWHPKSGAVDVTWDRLS